MTSRREPDEEIGDRVRNAGRRAPIPPEDLDFLRTRARAVWQETVVAERARRRRRRRAYAVAASLLVVVVAGGAWLLGRGSTEPVATVELCDGSVRIEGAGDLGPGRSLSAGTVLATGPGDANARLAVRMAGGSSLRLDAGTRLRLLSATRVELLGGAAYVDSEPLAHGGRGLEVQTALGAVRELGTQFEVRLGADGAAIRVRVREGVVSVTRDGESWNAERGEELTVRSNGPAVRKVVPTHGDAWRWVLAAAPAPPIEGRSLASYLEWVRRETGLEIRFADVELERSAQAIVLHGTVEGMRPDESLGTILLGSGLSHRVSDGTVLIDRR